MLDLGSDVNILPRETWEALGKPQFTFSPSLADSELVLYTSNWETRGCGSRCSRSKDTSRF